VVPFRRRLGALRRSFRFCHHSSESFIESQQSVLVRP
jgi:hypothetical protein